MRHVPPLLVRRAPGAMMWLIAASCLMLILAAAAALALGAAAQRLDGALARRLIVQVIEPELIPRDALAAEIVAELQARRDVASLRRLGNDEIARLIAPYFGRPADRDGAGGTAALPVPALIDVTLTPAADPARLRAALGRHAAVTVAPAGAGLAPLAGMIATLRTIALAIAGIGAAATALIAILAARAALAGEAQTIAILHGLGASDRQVAQAVAVQIVRDAGAGAAIGLIGALLAVIAVGRRFPGLEPGLTAGAVEIGWAGWILLVLLAGATMLLAAGAALAALFAQLGRVP